VAFRCPIAVGPKAKVCATPIQQPGGDPGRVRAGARTPRVTQASGSSVRDFKLEERRHHACGVHSLQWPAPRPSVGVIGRACTSPKPLESDHDGSWAASPSGVFRNNQQLFRHRLAPPRLYRRHRPCSATREYTIASAEDCVPTNVSSRPWISIAADSNLPATPQDQPARWFPLRSSAQGDTSQNLPCSGDLPPAPSLTRRWPRWWVAWKLRRPW